MKTPRANNHLTDLFIAFSAHVYAEFPHFSPFFKLGTVFAYY